MKKIVCDLCESTEFTKEGGFFICQGCGTKYSLEEAKAMMREVEGSAPVSTGAPVTAVPMGNPNQQQIDNILVLATTAYEAQNYAEAENYCNQAVVLDAMCYKAWNLKGKAVGWSSKMDNMRVEEAAHSFCKAIDFAPEEEKEELKTQAAEELKRLGLAIIATRKKRFAADPSKAELNGFASDKKVLLDSLLILLSHGNAVGIPEGYLEEVASEMNLAAVAALNMVRKAWNGVEHPSEKDFDTYLDWIGNIEQLLRQAIDTSDDDDEEDIVRYKNLKIVLGEPMNAHSYKQVWNSYASRYDWQVEYSLAQSAKDVRSRLMKECDDKIKELEKKVSDKKAAEAMKAEEEIQARIKAYWEAHAEEKAALDAEQKELEAKKESLTSEIAGLDAEIKALEPKGAVPSEAEDEKLIDQIRDLVNQRSKLGIFAGKQKNQITEEIASLNGRRDALKSKIEDEKNARQAEADKKMAPLKEKRAELQSQLDAATKRINAIVNELTKDPEA